MKIVFITFLVSTAASVTFWQFGLGEAIWPSHPFLATIGSAVACGVAVQFVLEREQST